MATNEMEPPRLVLASTSRYRAELLARLGIPFDAEAPRVDETAQPHEQAGALAQRLARAKAEAVSASRPNAVIVGSDQTLAADGEILGKPGTAQRARRQLASLSGKTVVFHTAVCVVRATEALWLCAHDETRVSFRELDGAQISRYVAREPALDCAGSFKCEGLGITLFEAIETKDPTALVGLPLIAVARMLRQAGLDPFA